MVWDGENTPPRRTWRMRLTGKDWSRVYQRQGSIRSGFVNGPEHGTWIIVDSDFVRSVRYRISAWAEKAERIFGGM